jgi:catechol 2,3-dioxygenase-like lactoylglutathione lyase family enzyme
MGLLSEVTMAVTLNHLIVPAHDKVASAKVVADILGLKVGGKSPGNAPEGYFAVVPVGETHLDFFDVPQFEPHRYAFIVSGKEFDTILDRVKWAGVEYSADPLHKQINEINHLEGGRGFYFGELNGHNLEVLMRP